jgi:hypothetical protein
MERILTKLGCAILFSIMLTITTGGTFRQGMRFVAATCFIISFGLFAIALTRRRRSLDQPSEWDEAFVFSFLAAGAHFLARLF